jgi:hypothetical protein
VVDLQQGIAEQVSCLLSAGQDVPCELAIRRGHPVPVGVRGWAADPLAGGEGTFVLGNALDAEQPVLEGVLVRETGRVGAGISLN